ncbi:MAG: lipid-A-disaccharide synthase [Maricaulis sp.]|uniref:lipid-A-disaccharide synthase n=1 Tax=Maricaulis sp. TaxID=1486257 RepID=UPI00262EDB83|nr:lipid-A-disaccharide synthase [Maricaulis sp.]MDM7982852.1 lipid-A-disaccharide synthase [Maricaulis sp.]
MREDKPLVYVVAAERSGDLLGAGLIRAMRAKCGSDIAFRGMGGEAMAEEGVPTTVSIDGLSILGFFDGLKAYGRIKERVAEVVADILIHKPQAVVLIDSWGFMLRVAQGVRAQDPSIKLIKYVGPQVFATRPGRAKTLAGAVDHLMTILSFDARYYEPHGLPVTFVGNPTLDRIEPGDGAGFRSRHGIASDAQTLLVLFGSRKSEIDRVGPAFMDTLKRLTAARELTPIIVVAGAVKAHLSPRLDQARQEFGAVIVEEEEKTDAFAAADIALACSGTVVTELATAGVPTVTAYKLGWLTWAIIRAFGVMKAPFISLVNIAANEMLVPEFVQTRCRGDLLAVEVSALLDDPKRRERLHTELAAATDKLRGEGDASENAAQRVCELSGAAVAYWRRSLGRRASFLEVKEPSLPSDITASVFGDVRAEIPGEIWPSFKGKPLRPLCQLNVAQAPFRPKIISDLSMISVFIAEEFWEAGGYLDIEDATRPPNAAFYVRVYRSLDGLVPVHAPEHGSVLSPHTASWMSAAGLDYPSHDLLPGPALTDLEDVMERSWPSTREGVKLGGWPYCVQSEPFWKREHLDKRFEHVLQIDSEEKSGWMWGDMGCASLARSSTQPNYWALDWQCH